MMRVKKYGLGIALVGALILSVWSPVHAIGPILFDPDGPGGADPTVLVGSFDWAPGNALAVGAVSTAPGAVTFDLLAHSSLGVLNNVGGVPDPSLSPGLSSAYEITFVTRFPETGTVVFLDTTGALGVPDGIPDQSIIVFSGPPAGTNFFEVYADTAHNANPITGTGYNDGTLILSGTITTASGNFASFFDTPAGSPGAGIPGASNPNAAQAPFGAEGYHLLDQFGADTYFIPGTQTVDGSGGTILTVDVTFQDFGYFITDVMSLLVDAFTNTSNNLPFRQTDPSGLFTGAAGGGAPTVVPNVGPINGQLPAICFTVTGGDVSCLTAEDVQFQADANSSFNPTVVPEPSALVLLGLGLVSLAAAGGHLRLARKS